MAIQTASMEEARTKLANREKRKRGIADNGIDHSNIAYARDVCDEDTMEFPHEKQILDLIA